MTTRSTMSTPLAPWSLVLYGVVILHLYIRAYRFDDSAFILGTTIPARSGKTWTTNWYFFRQFRGAASSVLALIVAVLASGCATPVGVKHVDQETAYRALDANILSNGEPSAYSRQLLERHALIKLYQNDPEQVISEPYSGFGQPDEY